MADESLDGVVNRVWILVARLANAAVSSGFNSFKMARQMIPAGHDPARIALEDMAVEAYRAHRLTEHQLATLLGVGRYHLDGFLKGRGVWLDCSVDDLQQEVEVGERLWKKRQEEIAASGK